MIRRSVHHNKYAFYDLVRATYSHPSEPIESARTLKKLRASSKEPSSKVFEGNYKLDEQTKEERINKIFGGRIKGEPPKSSSRILRSEPRKIAGVLVPAKPIEPDNCCMSGCINCVWELFNDDLKDWNLKRKEAAQALAKRGGRWPEDFDAPVNYLKAENLPRNALKELQRVDHSDEGWNNVPVSIRVFAEMEKKMKEKRQRQQQ